MTRPFHERPMAASGLKSYRYPGTYGYVMIGAKDTKDALREAKRSCRSAVIERLDVWDGERYVAAKGFV